MTFPRILLWLSFALWRQASGSVIDANDMKCRLYSVAERFDCHPEPNASPEACNSRGCCWAGLAESDDSGADVPYCYYPENYVGYSVSGPVTVLDDKVLVELHRQTPSGIDADVENIVVEVLFYDKNTVRVKVSNPAERRFVPPVPRIPSRSFAGDRQYVVNVTSAGQLSIHRLDGVTIFNASLSRLVFTDHFLELSTRINTYYVYGLGEQWGPLRRNMQWSRHTFFNRDDPPIQNKNLYGTQPVYLGVEKDGRSHGVFLHNSNSMEVVLQPTPAVTFRALGGILDLFVFVGPSPANVVQQLQNVIGLPAMPPYWGLGFHLCRFGYGSLNRTRFIMEKNIEAGIPLDVQWNDIDYMDKQNDFTYDRVKYDGLPTFVDELHRGGRHYVVIVDPAVSGSEAPGTYPPYDEGLAMDIFVKNVTGGVVYAKVWNDKTSVFPDFSHPQAELYWESQIRRFHKEVPHDGAWIDMNEPANFYNGHADGCPPDQKLENPPYVPGGEKLSTKTLCMSDQHHIGPHYNVHNIYSQLEAEATYRALVNIRGKRPFIISRATSPGQGAWSGHWSGDISSSWEDLRFSIPNMLSFAMYGMPLVGADICGFNQNTTVELCARWQALGAFYPFSRNHNTDDAKDQDPYSLGPVVVDAARSTLIKRYSILPYLYTLFYRSHVFGETVARPLFFEFPDDPRTYEIDEQFLWGPALLFNPALYEGQTEVNAYVPAGVWYDADRGTVYADETGQNVTFPAPMNWVTTLIRGGQIVPGQDPSTTTTQSRKNPLFLLVAPDDKGTARGELFWDDGDSLDTIAEGRYSLYEFRLIQDLLVVTCSKDGYEDDDLILGHVVVYDVNQSPRDVTMGGRSLPFVYQADTKVLLIMAIQASLRQDLFISWH